MDRNETSANAAPGRTQSLYRKYRPETFQADELVGQDHVRRTLQNAIVQNRVSHAYLFCGPRGTGKTTTARLLAKAVNCTDPDPENRPCNECQACISINQGRATDVIEIDAASNRGIEDIRNLREQVKYAPTQLQHKFYIIDEAHRLTRDAFNAFLKTLEEPPPNTTFVLATTDPDELLETVASRCQRFDFQRIPAEQMIQRTRHVCELEGIEIDDEALAIVVRHSTGSLRDALSLVDMLATSVGEDGHERIDAALTLRMLGLSQDERTLGLINALADRDLPAGLAIINDVVDSGQDMRAYGRQVIGALRLLMLCRAGAKPAEADAALHELAARFELPDLLHINRQFSEIDFAIRHGGFPQLPIELAFLNSLVGDPSAAVTQQAAPVARPVQTSPADGPPRDALSSTPPSPMPRARPAPQRPSDENDVRRAPSPPSADTRRPQHVSNGSSDAGQSAVADPSLEAILDRWHEIRTEVKASDRKIEALMASADPGAVVDNTLILLAAYPFHASKLNESRVREILEEAVDRVTGERLAVNTVLRDDFTAPPPTSNPPGSSNPPSDGSSGDRPRRSTPDVDAAAPDEPEAISPDDEETERIVGRMKALFGADEIDLADVPANVDLSR